MVGGYETQDIPVTAVENGLTPTEREVTVLLGGTTIHVLVSKDSVNKQAKTLRVHVAPHPDLKGYVIIDLRGESLNGTNRIVIQRDKLPGAFPA